MKKGSGTINETADNDTEIYAVQIAYALFKFLSQKDISEEHRMQAEQELNLATYNVMSLIQYRGKKK